MASSTHDVRLLDKNCVQPFSSLARAVSAQGGGASSVLIREVGKLDPAREDMKDETALRKALSEHLESALAVADELRESGSVRLSHGARPQNSERYLIKMLGTEKRWSVGRFDA